MTDWRTAYLKSFTSALDCRAAYQNEIEGVMSKAEAGDSFPLDKMDQRTSRTVLFSEDGQAVLTAVWKHELHRRDAEQQRFEVGQKTPSARLTANALANSLLGELRAGDHLMLDAFKKRVAAIVKAGIAYGLIERRVVGPTRKPLLPTYALDALFERTVQTATSQDLSTIASGRLTGGGAILVLELPNVTDGVDTPVWREEMRRAVGEAIAELDGARQAVKPVEVVLRVSPSMPDKAFEYLAELGQGTARSKGKRAVQSEAIGPLYLRKLF